MPDDVRSLRAIERWLEAILFGARWLMAPFYLGLVTALIALLVVFVKELAVEIAHIAEMTAENAILMALSLIDLSLAGNLLLIVIFSGYENFVSKIETSLDRPAWMGTVDFTGLKLKLISSIVAISAIALLRAFMRIGSAPIDETELKWRVIVHLTFVISGAMLALMDFISSRTHGHSPVAEAKPPPAA